MQHATSEAPPVIQRRPLTHKMQQFADLVAEGKKLSEAYRTTFNTGTMKPKTIRDEASRLAKNPGVAAAIAERKSEIERENRMRALGREERIWTLVWGLVEDQAVLPSVRVRTLDLAARLCGMFKCPSDLAPLSSAEVESELRSRLVGLRNPFIDGSSCPERL
jgi:hypothetical protein